MAAITVVLADDHPVFRSGLRQELGAGFEVVAETADAAETVAAVRRLRPDVVACDLAMPGGGGLAVAASCGAETAVVILTVHEGERDVLDAVAAGAMGYLLKTATASELRAALRRAAAGEPVFSPTLASLVMGEFRRLARSAGAEPLSPREREVLGLVARGMSNKQVAAELVVSPKTVENHVGNVLRKLHLSRRDQLIRYAIDRRLD